MDHDDSDFQSQNIQLAGENSSKFSSGLRPFALPKLNIDEQLQNHLRFDNLVDSEVFFSVQGHASSWIEDLSTGSSIIDFSSSATESCSISKANNVWSEATSTESVEMLLKSVGESEMTGNMDGNALNQLRGMDSQIDPSNEQPKSINSPTDSTVLPTDIDQSQSTRSGMIGGPEHSQGTRSTMTDDPSGTQSQLDHFAPFSMDEKGIVNEQLSSSHKTPESCPAASNYFKAVNDDHSVDRLNTPSAELDSRKLNNEPFPELSPLQNIYVTDSYHFEHVNQESEVVAPQDSKICHIKENKVEGGLHDLQNLSRTGHSLGAVNLSSQVSNETILPGSSDGLLEAITNPVKMLQRNDDTCKTVRGTLQPSFSSVNQTAEGLKSSVNMSNKLVNKEFGIGSNSALSHQSEANLKTLNPHHNTHIPIESSKVSLSPKRMLDHGTGTPEETKNAGAGSTNIFSGDESKHVVLGDHQGSVGTPKIDAMEEKKIREDMSAVSGNIEQMVENDHEENGTGATYTSHEKFGSSDNIAPDAFHTSEDPKSPSVSSEGSFKEGDTPALEGPENTHLVLTDPWPQEKISAPLISSSSHIISSTVTDTFSGLKGKNDRSGDVSPGDASAVIPNVKDSGMSTMNHEEPFKGDAKSTLEDEDHNIISPVSEPGTEIPEITAVSVNPNTDAVCGDAASVAKKDKEHANSMGGLTTPETQDKSGNHPDFHSEKCQTGRSLIQSECHIDLATPSTLGTSSEKAVGKIVGTPLNAKDDLDPHVQDTVLNCGTDRSPGSVLSQAKLGSSGDGICADATFGSPSMSSHTEPSPQKGRHESSVLPNQTLVEQSENMTDNEASADFTQKLKQCSSSDKNVECTVASEEVNTAGDDRSFSFEVGASPNLSEKAHSPAWSPFPSFSAPESTEVTTENPQPKSSGKSLNNSSDEIKKTSVSEAGKEQVPERIITESSAGTSDKSKMSPPEPSRQHSTPEYSDLVSLPFTDSQHVQLRAQIFVYGALIQGTPPGEAYMVAAFGEPGTVGGGKPTWEAAWRASLERFQYQKSIYNGLETPKSSHSHIGTVSEKVTNGTAVKTAPSSKKGGKTVLPAQSAVALHSPTARPSSSTFNLQQGIHLDFSHSVSPLFAYNSHVRPPSGVAPWYHQSPGQRPAPWLVQPQNLVFDSSTQPAVPTNDTLKGPSSKNIPVSNAVSPSVFPQSSAPPIASQLAVVHEEKQKAPASTSKGTSSQKPRKRKKASASPEQQPPQLTTDMVSFSPAAKHSSGFTLSTSSPSNALASRPVHSIGQITSVPNYQITGSLDAEQRIKFSEQIHGAIEQSTGQVKGASLHAMEAVRHKESVWGHLSTIARNKIPPEVEQKLTSAAAAAEAAVSVAKAAAEAAKMASEAALQAKMMAEEALSSSKSVNSVQNLEAAELNVHTNPPSLLSSSPASSWKVKKNSHGPGSIVSVAREAARKRVEATSAAAKRAENLDAILEAAELAAEAVFNAGTIIGMGDPLPFTLSELLEAGPGGLWKSDQVRNIEAGNGNCNLLAEPLQVVMPANINKSSKKRGRKPKSDQSLLNSEPSSSARELQPDGMQSGNGVKRVRATASGDGRNNNRALKSIVWNGIEKGSAVEVSSYVDGFGAAWFSAKVVDMNEDSALISYDNQHEGNRPHEEWVPLILEGDKAPRIRLAHPATLSKFKTRKRRRETTGNCSWVTGDHVDAWLNNRWREGVIAQTFEADETKFVVQFSDAGSADSLVVEACNLRSSLVWKDSQWIEWPRVRERKSKSNKGDSPLEKRQRTDPLHAGIDKPLGEAGGPSKDTSTNNSKKPEELRPLPLSQRDMVFNIGKSVAVNKTEALAFKRPGLQKEGSRVVYGVPKHGKKKKFMEVSKHYVQGQSDKTSEGNTSSKVASSRVTKHMVPPLARRRDNTLKTDQRGRRVGETRPRGPPKSSRSQTASANTIPDKDSLHMPAPNPGVFGRNFAFAGSTSTSNIEKSTAEKNKAALGPVPRIEDPSVSEMQAASTVPTSKQDVPTANRSKRKQHVPSVDNRSIRNPSERTTNSAEPQRTSTDSAEPRRSNRRIQPTSRLLEGLQSSLIVSKAPGEKGPRSTTSRGRTHG